MVGGKEQRIPFHELWNIFKIQISVSLNKILLEHTCPFTYILSMAIFELQSQTQKVATKTKWPPKPDLFTVESITENICWLLHQILLSHRLPTISFKLSASLASCLYRMCTGEPWKSWMYAITPRYGVCILFHRQGDDSPCECGLIDDSLQLPTGSWNNCFPIVCGPPPLCKCTCSLQSPNNSSQNRRESHPFYCHSYRDCKFRCCISSKCSVIIEVREEGTKRILAPVSPYSILQGKYTRDSLH